MTVTCLQIQDRSGGISLRQLSNRKTCAPATTGPVLAREWNVKHIPFWQVMHLEAEWTCKSLCGLRIARKRGEIVGVASDMHSCRSCYSTNPVTSSSASSPGSTPTRLAEMIPGINSLKPPRSTHAGAAFWVTVYVALFGCSVPSVLATGLFPTPSSTLAILRGLFQTSIFCHFVLFLSL